MIAIAKVQHSSVMELLSEKLPQKLDALFRIYQLKRIIVLARSKDAGRDPCPLLLTQM